MRTTGNPRDDDARRPRRVRVRRPANWAVDDWRGEDSPTRAEHDAHGCAPDIPRYGHDSPGYGGRAGQAPFGDPYAAGQTLAAGPGYGAEQSFGAEPGYGVEQGFGAAGRYAGYGFGDADDFLEQGFGPADETGPARASSRPAVPRRPGYEFGFSPAGEGNLPAGQDGRDDGGRDGRHGRDCAGAGRARRRAPGGSRRATGDATPNRAVHPSPLSRAGIKRWAARVALPMMSMVAVGIAAVATFGGSSGAAGPAPATLAVGFPPATPAASAFSATPPGQARGVEQSLSGVASSGSLVVAAGSQAGARIGRAQFFVSDDGGQAWRIAPEHARDGGDPSPGHAATLIAGGHGAWLGLGPDAMWTSRDGRSWTLVSTHGIAPAQRGDRVNVLRRTATGFLAAGENVPPGDPAASSPVIWTSSNGVTWRRLGAAQLHLGPAGTVAGVTFAAASGKAAVMSATITRTAGRHVTIRTPGVWQSMDGGATWTAANVPVSSGAESGLRGLAATSAGFVAIRPGQSNQAGPDAVAYVSADGRTWKLAATLTGQGGLGVEAVNGGAAGAVVTARSVGATVAFTSVNGISWRQAGTIAGATGQAISGVAVASGGAVVAAGTAAAGQVGSQAALTVANAGRVNPVNVAAVPGATEPEVALNGLAASGASQVAVGSVNGFPAAWLSADAGTTWTRAAGAPAAALDRPGVQELSGVAHGTAGWVAVGGVRSAAAQHPVVVTSPTGRDWQAADTAAAFGGSGVFTVAAAAGQAGYVVVGRQLIQGTAVVGGRRVVTSRTVPAAWWSPGLTGWRRAAGLDAPGASQQMLAAASRAGGFAAVGSDGNRPAAWTSANGRTWRPASLSVPPGAARAQLQHVTVNGRRIVAVGMSVTSAGQTAPFAADSVNGGATWTESLLPSPGGAATVDAVAATGAGFTATGAFGGGGRRDVVIWTSADGLTWKTSSPSVTGLSGRGIQEITALAVSGSMLTGVGFTASPASESPTIWRSPIRD